MKIWTRIKPFLPLGAAGLLAAVAGGFAAVALGVGSAAPPPTKTVTISVENGEPGATGPTGPAGPPGPTGPAGGIECVDGYSPGILVINSPGGHTSIYTCIVD